MAGRPKAKKKGRAAKCGKPPVHTRNGFSHDTRTGRFSIIAPDIHIGKLAAGVGICQSHMSKIISGTRTPSVAVIQRLAKVLDLTVDGVLSKIEKQDW